MQQKTLGQLAEHVGGKVCGDPKIVIKSVSTIEQAKEGDITFLANQKYENYLQTTNASAVITGKETKNKVSLLIADDPYFAFREIVVLLYGQRKHKESGISSKASIAKSAKIGKDCNIYDFVTISDNATVGDRCVFYPGVFIGPDVEIGDDCIVYPNAVIYDNCKIGSKVIIQANATIGNDGFGFSTHKGEHHKIPHIGAVVIEDEVELGSGCVIERGTLDDTVIGKGSKVWDLVAIGHGTKIGPYCLLVPQVGVSGSTTVGHHCVFGGQVGIVGHLNIGNCVKIGAQSGVNNDIPDGKIMLGSPAIEAGKTKRVWNVIKRLPEMRKSIQNLEKLINNTDKKKPS